MLTERSAKISGFVKEKYHVVRLGLGGFEASSGYITDQQEAEQIRAAADKKAAVCVSLTKEQKIISPPKLFDLTALQRDSNRLYGYTAQQTLDAAQKLYESKLITYPRTDSRFITEEMAIGIPPLVIDIAGMLPFTVEDLSINPAQVADNAKISDHHAIIPTAEIVKADISKLSETEQNILRLVSVRLVTALGDKHVFEAVTAVFNCGGYTFTAKGKTTIADGWKALENCFISTLKLKDTDSADGGRLPTITEGQEYSNAAATVTEHYTQPPKPYTEDTLLSAMENAGAEETDSEAERRGLGTPATRAAVIEKLVNGGFITRKGRQLTPTPDGENLIKVLPDTLKSPELTAKWENALTRIAKGEAKPDVFMRGIEDMARTLVTDYAEPDEQYKGFFMAREAVGTCPRCGGNVLESKKNFHCGNRDCQFVMWKADRFFVSRKKELTKTVAAELLKSGRAKIKGMYSEKKNKTFDAVILLADTGGKYVNYRFEINAGT
jgi:DNA topoisomerase-3